MNKKVNKSKSDFVNLFLSTVESDSNNKETANAFLAADGVNVDRTVSEGLKRIKQMQMLIDAKKTEQDMVATESVKQKATDWVDNLLNSIDFSLPALVQKEELTVSFRNVESLSSEDIRTILIRHFILKFMKQQNDKQNEF